MPALQRIVTAYAPSGRRAWVSLCWAIDLRLANALRAAREPTLTAIRLAWWDDVLIADDPAKGRGEPLADAWRAACPSAEMRAAAAQLIDGWRALIGEELLEQDLENYATGRGSGLSALLAGEPLAPDFQGGGVFALWDLAAHSGDEMLAERAMQSARKCALNLGPLPTGHDARIVRLLTGLVLADARQGRVPIDGFRPRHYLRLIRLGLFD